MCFSSSKADPPVTHLLFIKLQFLSRPCRRSSCNETYRPSFAPTHLLFDQSNESTKTAPTEYSGQSLARFTPEGTYRPLNRILKMIRGLDGCYIPQCCIHEDDEEAEMMKNGTSRIPVWWPPLLRVHKRLLNELCEESHGDRKGPAHTVRVGWFKAVALSGNTWLGRHGCHRS